MALTYKLQYTFIRKITSPIVVKIGSTSIEYSSGEECANASFDKPYIIKEVSTIEGKILITLEENKAINDVSSWSKTDQSFF